MGNLHKSKGYFLPGKNHEPNGDFIRQPLNQTKDFTSLTRNQTTSYIRNIYSGNNTLLVNYN